MLRSGSSFGEVSLSSQLEGFQIFAGYNRWMNLKISECCAKLSEEELLKNRKSFFPSILGNLNHILLGDLIWLTRISSDRSLLKFLSNLPTFEFKGLDELRHRKLDSYKVERELIDHIILDFIDRLEIDSLSQTISYKTTGGQEFNNPLWLILTHLFNHQTHHRGQISTLLNQDGHDLGSTDFVYYNRFVHKTLA